MIVIWWSLYGTYLTALNSPSPNHIHLSFVFTWKSINLLSYMNTYSRSRFAYSPFVYILFPNYKKFNSGMTFFFLIISFHSRGYAGVCWSSSLTKNSWKQAKKVEERSGFLIKVQSRVQETWFFFLPQTSSYETYSR